MAQNDDRKRQMQRAGGLSSMLPVGGSGKIPSIHARPVEGAVWRESRAAHTHVDPLCMQVRRPCMQGSRFLFTDTIRSESTPVCHPSSRINTPKKSARDSMTPTTACPCAHRTDLKDASCHFHLFTASDANQQADDSACSSRNSFKHFTQFMMGLEGERIFL